MTQQRRPRGTGAFYYRSRDGLWIGKWKGSIVTSRDRQVALEKLYAILPEGTPFVDEVPVTPLSQTDAGRERGTHTDEQWQAMLRDRRHACNYCGQVIRDGMTKDHVIPFNRGGSDAIHNIVPSCRPCNRDKGDMTAEEYFAWRSREEEPQRSRSRSVVYRRGGVVTRP